MMKRLFTLTMLASVMLSSALAANPAAANITPSKAPAFAPENLPVTYLTEAEGEA